MIVNTGVIYPKEPKTPGSTYFKPKHQKTKANPEGKSPKYRIENQIDKGKLKSKGILRITTKNKSIISPSRIAPVVLISPPY